MKLDKLKKYISGVPKHVWVLVFIVAIGIFLRTWHFRDWLLFNPDQARDATVVDSVLNGERSWNILGPEAGNTRFDLGPWFYHLEIISASIFGNAPDKMAYPDLLFSVLAIPLFYVFAKKYFTTNLSLALSGLFSMSFFAVKYSRFAWNPNSIPFFVLVFLLGILNLLEPDKRKSFWGAVMVGTGIGVGLQLHILLLFIMPAVTAAAFLYLFVRKRPIISLIKKLGIIILLILVTNAGQIVYEIEHGRSNIKKFIKSTNTEVEIKAGKNLQMDLLCLAQANLHIISSLGNAEQCDYYDVYREYFDKANQFIASESNTSINLVAGGALFSLGGFLLLAYFWRRETDERKKNFLGLCGIYGLATLAAMFPIINQVEPRYYVVSSFLPFIFLGIMAEGLLRWKKIWIKIFVGTVFAALFWANVSTEAKTAERFFAGMANDKENCFLGEAESMADYMVANAHGSKVAYIPGKNENVSRYFKPLNYILKRRGIDLKHSKKADVASNFDVPTFFVVKASNYKYWVDGKIGTYRIKQMKVFGNVTIIIPGDT